MSIKYSKLSKASLKTLPVGKKISEHGICFERMKNCDGRFSINAMVDGQRIHRVVGKESEGVTRTMVEQVLQQLKTEARNHRLNLPSGRKVSLGLSEASELYLRKLSDIGVKDANKKRSRIELHLRPFFLAMPIAKITSFDIERYKKNRLKQGAANSTINRELSILSHLLNQAVDWGWIPHNSLKIKRAKEEASRIVYLTKQQIEDLLEAARLDGDPVVLPFCMIGLATAMRKTEILSIRIENIDLLRKLIFIPQAKAGAREQPITAALGCFLSGHLENRPKSGWLFPSQKSASGHVMNFEKSWKRIVEAAGLDSRKVVRHTLRHTAITHLVQAGVDLPTVKRISGHKTLQMVERYSHQNGAHIEAAMMKLESSYS